MADVPRGQEHVQAAYLDIKPASNTITRSLLDIVVTEDGSLKLIDYGVAKMDAQPVSFKRDWQSLESVLRDIVEKVHNRRHAWELKDIASVFLEQPDVLQHLEQIKWSGQSS